MSISEFAKGLKESVIEIRRHLHQNPELSNSEYETAKFVAKKLEDLGIEVKTGVGGTGVVGLLKGTQPGKTLGLRADMDALPIDENTGLDFASKNSGVMHACGHDIHTSVLLGCATVLSQYRELLKGDIKFIFQPAEEKLIGAPQMIKDGVLENPMVDAIMALHTWPDLPAGTIGVKRGQVMAAGDSIDITIKGKQGHAAHPHKAIDPITIAGHVITKLQTIISREISPVDPVVITIGKISGGTSFNIIPTEVELTGTVRMLNPEVRNKMPETIERIVSKTAEAMNGEAEVIYKFGPPPLINDDHLVDLLEETVTEVLGKEFFTYMESPSLGSEDFAFYLQKVPGLFFRLGTNSEKVQNKFPLHHPSIIFDEDALVTGITVMSENAIRFLDQS